MSALANMFSVLGLDGVDDGEQIEALSSASAASEGEAGASKRSDKRKTNGKLPETREDQGIAKCEQGSFSLPAEEYKMPLVWIDLEMTGLNVEVDRILEIACIITDGKLAKSVEGPDLVIRQPKECLDNMGEWCLNHHAASGLTKRVLQSTISEKEAEKQVIEFVKEHIGPHTPLLAGNSIYVDFLFLKKYMPNLANIFPHVLVDVSSIMALCVRWFPREKKRAPLKEKRHRAMDDIKESIKELKYYKDNIFKVPNKSKK
ncbi:oligoribonuclease [Iris pallida]|uniref:Oligoribonuclease n=1 Tax=Iris pallida TaxID=29817 RepID=A0AAX6HC72_IRIPA|nr:oligoribonuclease [Iris pallida]KAJ6853650.1 oligoribonuclease [Iris pallida]